MLNHQFSSNLTPDELFTSCYEGYERLTFFVIRNVVEHSETAEDINQNLWMALFEKKEKLYKAIYQDNVNPSAYFAKAAKNKAIDYLRLKKLNVTFMEEQKIVFFNNQQSSGIANNEFIVAEEQKALQNLMHHKLNSLTKKQRSAFVLWLHGYAYSAIAEELSIPVTSVTKRLHNAKNNLKS